MLSASQLETLGQALHEGAFQASGALGRWIGKPASIRLEAVEQLPLAEATGVLDMPSAYASTSFSISSKESLSW